MQENNYKIIAFRIVKIDCTIDVPPTEAPITISVEDTVSCRKPSNPEKKIGLLKVETQIASDDSDQFKFNILSETVFGFDKMPDDFDKALKSECYPLAKERIQRAIKEITSAMGVTPLDLATPE